jgi:anti-sigma regulatory factor (Ser/Thr protein kinase)
MSARSERIRLPATGAAPRLARELVVAVCEGLPNDLIVAAELLTSELVTNAVTHPDSAPDSDPTVTVQIWRTQDLLRVEVIDDEPTPLPPVGAPSALAEHGWGLHLVDELADTWGSHPLSVGVGKTVWFELQISTQG